MKLIKDSLFKYFNKFSVNQDYEFARECLKALEDQYHNQERNIDKLFHLEGIFLDLTDRTQSHPRVPFGVEDRGGMFGNFVKELGFGNQKIVWKYTEVFNLDNYAHANWFPAKLVTYEREYEEMNRTKILYISRKISFMEYFFKRLDVYSGISDPDFDRFYNGIDWMKYIKKLKDITLNLPDLKDQKSGIY